VIIPDFETIWKVAGLPVPEMETRFHPKRKWRIDYFWPQYNLAVEIQGGMFVNGRHVTGAGSLGDMEKFNFLTLCGYRLLLFTPRQVKSGYASAMIRAFIRGDKNPQLPLIPEMRKRKCRFPINKKFRILNYEKRLE
jgi:hypothetical protein